MIVTEIGSRIHKDVVSKTFITRRRRHSVFPLMRKSCEQTVVGPSTVLFMTREITSFLKSFCLTTEQHAAHNNTTTT
jgi:hypothetical protein